MSQMSPPPLSYASPVQPAQNCSFCGRPLGALLYRIGPRPACENCAAQAIEIMKRNQPQIGPAVIGALCGIGAAILCGIGWAVIAHVAHAEIGFVAIGIGYLVARAVLAGAKGQRSDATRAIAMICSLGGVWLGKVLWVLLTAIQSPRFAGGWTPHQIIALFFILAIVPIKAFQAFDLVWYGLAGWQAWRMARPIRLRVEGPFPNMQATPAQGAPENYFAAAVPASPASRVTKRRGPAQAVMITLISASVSAMIYSQQDGIVFAVGFVLCILIHELGHTVACLAYGLPASAPIFIPYVGALITLRAPPPNAKVEAIIGIAGPIGGLLAATVCYLWFLKAHSPMAAGLVEFGAMMNLFNLLPIHPLDGGRISRGVAPAFWVLLIPALAYASTAAPLIGMTTNLAILLSVITLFGIGWTLYNRKGPYYSFSPIAAWMIGFAYAGVAAVLFWMLFQVHGVAKVW